MLLKGNSIAFSKQKKEFYKIILKGKESKKRPFRWQQGAVKTIAVKSLKAGKVDVKCNRKVYQLTFKGTRTQNIKL